MPASSYNNAIAIAAAFATYDAGFKLRALLLCPEKNEKGMLTKREPAMHSELQSREHLRRIFGTLLFAFRTAKLFGNWKHADNKKNGHNLRTQC